MTIKNVNKKIPLSLIFSSELKCGEFIKRSGAGLAEKFSYEVTELKKDDEEKLAQSLSKKSSCLLFLGCSFARVHYKILAAIELLGEKRIILVYETPSELDDALLNLSQSLYSKAMVETKLEALVEREWKVIASIESQLHLSDEILQIGLSLAKEKNTHKLLNEILVQSMKITQADAGSLAVLGLDKHLMQTEKDILTFYASKNNSKEIGFTRFSLKIDKHSLAGYTVLEKKPLNIKDAYTIPKRANYKFNKSFDNTTGFRTKSILVVPMVNQKEEVIGIIQIINKKQKYEDLIDYDNFASSSILEFTQEDQRKLTSLTSFATISLQNAVLYNEIDQLFTSFVAAAVSAVDQRDPATSGHSFRVADYTTRLAISVNKAGGILENLNFSPEQLREIEYASLLHDFGKIGVSEHVLLKAKKIEGADLQQVYRKFEVAIANLQRECEAEKIALITKEKPQPSELPSLLEEITKRYQRKIDELLEYKAIVEKSNEPMVLEKEAPESLKKIYHYTFQNPINNKEENLITEEEMHYLSIKRGSLSSEERRQIESHVTFSFEFLQKIPWTKDLKMVPEIAHGHHEKLNGAGYPLHRKGKEILPQTRLMTIADIYDALTAADRPYKKAISTELALKIITEEVEEGAIDPHFFALFKKDKIYQP